MSELIDGVVRAAHDVRSAGGSIALIGGLAVSAYGHSRFTADVDFAVAVKSDSEAETLIHNLVRAGYAVKSLLEQEVIGKIATVRLEVPDTGLSPLIVDLLFASCGIESEVVLAAEFIEAFPGITFPVARVGHLVAMKLLSERDHRAHDRTDLDAMLAEITPEELQLAREAVALIEARGFNRGRDLAASLNDWLSRPRIQQESP